MNNPSRDAVSSPARGLPSSRRRARARVTGSSRGDGQGLEGHRNLGGSIAPAVQCAGGELPTDPLRQPLGVAHRPPASPVKWLRPLAIVAGGGIVVGLVWEIGPSTLVDELRKLSWRLPLILLPQI